MAQLLDRAVPILRSSFSITRRAVDVFVKYCRSSSQLTDAHCSLDTGERLLNHSYPLRRIVCRTIELSAVENLVTATQERRDGNPRQSFPKMGDKLNSFSPRSSVPDHDYPHWTI